MTTKTDLLPSSVAAFTEALKGGRGSLDAWLEVNDERDVVAHVEAYARANVAVATATLQAEIERLRAEVELWRHKAAIHKYRRKRLAEALRPHIEDLEGCAVIMDQYPAMAPTAAEMRKAAAELRAALHPTAAQAAEIEALRKERDALRGALEEAEEAMRFVHTSCATFPQEPQHIQNAAWRRIVDAITKARAALSKEDE